MFTLRIFLIGMMAFVPTRDQKTLYVLLPNVDPHHALLALDKRDMASGGEATANQWSEVAPVVNGAENDNAFAWFLKEDRLEVLDSAGNPLELVTPKLGKAMPATKEEGRSISWVPSLQDVSPQIDATLDPSLLTAPSKDRLFALLTLQHGKVVTYDLTRYPDTKGRNTGDLVKFAYAPGSPDTPAAGCSRALAEIVVVEIPVSGPSVSLRRLPFSGGAGTSLTLKPRADQKTVDVLLANLTPSSQAELRKRSSPLHFAHYYDLLKTPPAAQGLRLIPKACGDVSVRAKKTNGKKRRSEPAVVAPPEVYFMTVKDGPRASLARPICAATFLNPVDGQ
jgi:hypothetical protein